MSDQKEPVAEEPVVETPTLEPTVETPDLSAEVEKWKALSRKNEERAKANEGKAKSFDDLEEANRTESEKLQARAEAAEKALAERDAKETLTALVAEVAKDKNVPAAILRGATREELEEHAGTYLASLPVIPNAPSADGLGTVGEPIGDDIGQIKTLEELKALTPGQVNEARRAGRLKTLGA